MLRTVGIIAATALLTLSACAVELEAERRGGRGGGGRGGGGGGYEMGY